MEMGAADIFLKAAHPPVFRVGNTYKQSSLTGPQHEELLEFLQEIVSPAAFSKYLADRELDFSISVPGLNRFRVAAFQQSQALAMVFRPIPGLIPTVETLQIPGPVLDAATRESGLFLVCGTTGSGKSTTIAAILEWINQRKENRIITLENPIEFVFKDMKCDFLQREFRRDFASFSDALGAALRQDPDIIFVGEMRELETIELALKAAETGHLVFSTLHSSTVAGAIDRICTVFPIDTRPFIQEQLASTILCVTTQILLTLADGSGKRIAAREILFNTHAIANLIRSGRNDQIDSYLQNSKEDRMVSMNSSLEMLVAKGLVKSEEALARSPDPDGLMTRLARRTKR